MLNDLYSETKQHMSKSIENLQKEYSLLRTGRANPHLLERIQVEYYGAPTPLNQLASVGAPEPRMLIVQPYDKTVIGDIEKAILASDIGITPNNDGNVIRLVFPQLTEERRKDLVKVVKKKEEETKIAIRNIRREKMDIIKDMKKKSDITEDDQKKAQDEIQKITDEYVENTSKIAKAKEEDIMKV
ncbi:MAG: ribosome recycling factor [Candidatus Muiribacterium halophilum]|uniref:Ribosome-recycling factor n=1 Tax=Muiribacterium halophilum TaxID=2053465 RepID=A0A2N5ZBC6_MUIH1|nr:MAG: ribosome recycling factor [Candidatus Muirbacterium halophilum]